MRSDRRSECAPLSQLGQNPRPLQEMATSRSARQASQRNRAKPPARNPHRRNARNSSSTNRATRRRPEAAQTRRGTSQSGLARRVQDRRARLSRGGTRLGAHRPHRAGTVPTNPRRGVAAAAGSGVNAGSICVPTCHAETEESRASARRTHPQGHPAGCRWREELGEPASPIRPTRATSLA